MMISVFMFTIFITVSSLLGHVIQCVTISVDTIGIYKSDNEFDRKVFFWDLSA